MRPRSARNSKRRKISLSCERSGGLETTSSRSMSSSRSRRIVARSFDARVCSACSMSDRERAGESSPACSSTPSTEPYCAMSCPAVLSPMPGTPGMLSLVSPFSPMKSGIWSGRIPYRSSTRSGVYTWTSATPRGVIIRHTFSETSWKASRSVDTTHVLMPASSARVASVAMTSSASQPSNSRLR